MKLQAIAPKLTREDELYVLSLTDLTERTLGEDAGKLVAGKALSLNDTYVALCQPH